MADQYYYFTGTCKWAKLQSPDEMYDTFNVCLYMDEESEKAFDSSPFTMNYRTDDDGRFIRFRRANAPKEVRGRLVHPGGKPLVMDKEGNVFDGLVGNGSNVTVKILAYPYKYGSKSGFGHRLEAVKINELVEYEPRITSEDTGTPNAGSFLPF